MGKKITKGTQKVNPVLDASIASPPYETASGMSNTEVGKRGKHDKQVDSYSCKCVNKKPKKNRKRTRTWESIQNLYGDADTTEVWDNQEQKPKAMYRTKLHKHEKPKFIDQSENNDVIMYPTPKFKNKPAKLSLLSLYRKRKIKDNTIKIGHLNENTKETDVQSLPYVEPKLRFMLQKKPKKGLQDRYATGDICTEGPCREALEKLYNLQGFKYTPETNVMSEKKKVAKSGKNKQSKKERNRSKIPTRESKNAKKSKKKQIEAIKTTTDRNVGYGDQISPTVLKEKDLKDVQCKSSFIGRIMRHTICKCKSNNERKVKNSSKPTICTCKNNNEGTLRTSSKHTICTCENNKGRTLQTSSKHTICKCKNNNERTLQASIKHSISKLKHKKERTREISSNHSICKCKNNNERTLQASIKQPVSKFKHKKETAHETTSDHSICKCKTENKEERKLKTSSKHSISKLKHKKERTREISSNHSICKCKNNNERTLQASIKQPVSKFKHKKETAHETTSDHSICKCKNENKEERKLKTSSKHSISKYKNIIERTLQTFSKQSICKCKNNNERPLPIPSNLNNKTGDTFLEMKVNSTDMRVINSSEVHDKIRRLGRIEKNVSCKCPSRMKRLNGNQFCEKGLCENALINRHNTYFNCKCRKKSLNIKNNIECKDSTCDLQVQDVKVKTRKKKRSRSPKYTKKKQPLLEVMLDSNEMNIVNSNEIEDIIRTTSQNKKICPTGICNTVSKKNNVQLNCKCIGKKLAPFTNECEERTCRNPENRFRLSYLNSRMFSNSENWNNQEGNRTMRPIRGSQYGTHKRNGVMINLPRGQKPKKGTYVGGRLSDAWSKCFCECEKKLKENKKQKPKKKVPRRRRRRGFFRRKKKDHRTVCEKILDCLEKEEEQCEYRVQKKTKEYKKNEKKAIKENAKMVKQQKEIYTKNLHHWNCFTSFISGVLNVGFESVKMVFKITFSVIGDPISSYIYVKEKSKNPPAAIIRIYEWFVRTWGNKSTTISKRIEESSTLNVISDQIEDSAVYNVIFSPKGKSREEKMRYERRTRMRKRRMQKRQDEALYGCRHMLLTTMRKTPCLWFYHICPDLYPQCLGLISFMNNFLHIILYLVAIMCWTPCIVACEMCRACMCCFFCTH